MERGKVEGWGHYKCRRWVWWRTPREVASTEPRWWTWHGWGTWWGHGMGMNMHACGWYAWAWGHGFGWPGCSLIWTCATCQDGHVQATQNIPISEGGTNSSRMHNLAKSQTYWGLKLLLSDIKCMATIISIVIYHIFQENECVSVISAQHILVDKCAKSQYIQWLVPSVGSLVNSAKCWYSHAKC